MASSKPYERIEARDDGYLWVINYEEGKEQQPLLLHAAANLLKQLKEKWHEDVVVSNGDGDNDEEEDVVAEKGEEKQENKESDNDDDNEEEEEEEEASESNNQSETNPDATSEKEYESLERTLNLGDRIITTLTHIRLYKHDKRKKKRQHQSNRESKVKALQHQRDRLQLQKEQQQQEQQKETEVKIEEKPSHDGGEEDFQVVVKRKDSKKDDEQQDEEYEPQDPHIRLVRTLNSIRALAPILRQMLFHPDRKSHTIRCGPKKIQLHAGGKRIKSWLLGNHVFDVASTGAVNNMQSNLREILGFYLPEPIVAELIDNTIESKVEFWNRDWLVRTWPSPEKANSIHLGSPYEILAEFVTDETPNQELLDKIRKQCEACDNQFFPKEPSDGGKAKAEHNRYQQAVDKLHKTLSRILEKDFPGARLSIYGSCLSNLSLKASDVDLSLFLPQAEKAKKSFQNGFWEPARYEKEMTKLVRDVFRRLIRRKGEFKDMVPVTRARVPVVKGCYMNANNPYTADGSLHFDICFLNDIAVANSNLLREYSWFDESVRELMVVVKKWAKDNKICSAQDNSISSYAWLNMVIFYLQCSGYIPNLQSQELLQQYGLTRNPTEYWHNVNDLDTCYLTLEQANQVWKRPEHYEKEPISNTALLYGFFNFYAISFVRTVSMISIKRGNEDVLPKTVFRKCSPFFCIEDPFETYDSHMPHDLGIPVNETQTKRIFQLLREAEEHLRVHLLGQNEEDEDAEGNFTSLWPWPPSQPERNSVNGEKNSGGRRRGGRGKEGGRNRNNKKDEAKGGQKQQKKEQPKPDSKAPPSKSNTDEADSSKQKPKNAGEKNKGVKKSPPTSNPSDKNDDKGKKKTQEAGQSPAEAGGDASKKTDKSRSKDGKNDGNRSPRHAGGRGKGRGRGHKKSDKSHQSEEKKDGDNPSSDGQGRGNNKNSGGRGGRGRGGRGGRGRGRNGSGGRGGGGDKKAKGESSGN